MIIRVFSTSPSLLQGELHILTKPSLLRREGCSWRRYSSARVLVSQRSLCLCSKIIPSFFTIKEGSTSHLGLLQWSLHPLRFPRLRGNRREEEENRPTRCSNRYAIRLADQSGLARLCGMGPPGVERRFANI